MSIEARKAHDLTSVKPSSPRPKPSASTSRVRPNRASLAPSRPRRNGVGNENAEAIKADNDYVAKHGLPLAKYRLF